MSTKEGSLEARIIKKLAEGPCSVSTLAKSLKLRRDFLTGYLEAMRDTGKLQAINVGKARVYMPINRGAGNG